MQQRPKARHQEMQRIAGVISMAASWRLGSSMNVAQIGIPSQKSAERRRVVMKEI